MTSHNRKMMEIKTRKVCSLFVILIATILLFVSESSQAQAPTISYPTAAQNIIRGFGNSELNVKLVFNGICTGSTTVKIALPYSVSYVSGSVNKVSGTSGVSITETSVTDLRNPVFTISGLTAIGDEINFKILRNANCGTLTTAKDSVYVFTSGGCSNGTEISGTVNTYNILAPSLSVTAPTAITNAVIGTTSIRNTEITNGGNGATDTVRFFVVYPNAGIVNTSGTNAITANTISFSPIRVSGDTLFYNIFGTTLFGGDAHFSNGETIIITEPIKILKCNVTTSYGAGWGRNGSNICNWSTAQSETFMATGAPRYSALTSAAIGFVDKCTPFDYDIVLSNGGSGNVAAATMYDLKVLQGQGGQGTVLSNIDTSLFSITNIRIGTTSVPFSYTAGVMTIDFNNLLTSDPDGVGVGLDDIDGDGYYDDLPMGKSITVRSKITFKCTRTCGANKIHQGVSATLRYRTMCGTTFTTADRFNATGVNYLYEATFIGTSYIPANVVGGVPFRTNLKTTFYINSDSYSSSNTRYRWKLILPSGFAVSGTGAATYGTTPVTFTTSGDTIIYTSSTNNLQSFNIDLVYTCGTGGNKNLVYTLEKINNILTGCKCQGDLVCGTMTTNAFCPSSCTVGPISYIPKVERADGSLGWTNYTLATRTNRSSISSYDLSKALFLDTILIFGTSKQINAATNLYAELKLPKTTISPVNVNKLAAVNMQVSIYRGGSLINSCTLTSASSAASTTSTQSIDWNLTSCLPSGGLLAGDSIYTVSSYIVAVNDGLPQNDIQSGGSWNFYNINSTSTKDICNTAVPEMYLVGTSLVNGANLFVTNGCNNNSLGGSTNYLARRFNTAGTLFANEFRPVMYIDSIVATLPSGYTWNYTHFQPTAGPTFTNITPTVSENKYTFNNPGTWQALGLTITNAYGGYIPFNVSPTCATQAIENINFKFYIRDFYYAYAGKSTPSGLSYVLGGAAGQNRNISYSTISKPDISLSDQTGVIEAVTSNQSWTIRLSNTGLNTAPYTWIAIPNKAGINVTQITDVATSSIQTPISYSGGKWYKLSTAGIPSGQFKDYKIDFNFTSCTIDSLKIIGGWNCSEYPSTPDDYMCGVDSVKLKVNPKASQIQVGVLRQPGGGSPINLCTEDSILLVVNSAQSANLINPYVVIYPPSGLNISSTIKVEYPIGSGDYQNATVSAISGGGIKIDLSSHSGIITNGILGTSSANPSYSPVGGDRQAKIKVDYSTDCALVSGNSFVFYGYANMPCGAPATGNGVTTSTTALNITGASADGSAGALINIGVTSISCGAPSTLSLTTVPTSLPTQVGDTMIYTLPAGVGYAGNFVRGTNCSTCEISTATGSAGSTLVKVKLQTGVTSASALNYSFDIVPKGSVCGSINVSGIFKRLISPLSCGATMCTSSSVVLASATSPSILIKKPNLQIVSYSLVDTSIWLGGTAINKVKIKYSNTGTMAYTANTDSVELFCGTSSMPFAVLPLAKSLAIGAIDSDVHTLVLPTSACSMADLISTNAKIQTTNTNGREQCLCSSSNQILTVPPAVSSVINYCLGSSATALSAVGSSLKWYASASGGTPSTIAPTPSTSSVGVMYYYVSQTSATGIESPRAMITVNVRSIPAAPDVVNPVVYCQGSTATALSATKAASSDTLIWYLTSTATSGSTIAPTPSTSSVGSTDYYVSLKSEYGCEGSRSFISVNVNPRPSSPSVVSPVDYCKDALATALTATASSATDTLHWYLAAVGGIGSKTATVPSTAGVGSSNYYVSQKNSFGCESSRASITVNINALPTISGTASACVGQTSTLVGSATAHPTTAWTSSNTTIATVSSTGVVTGVSAGTVTITYRNSNNCITTLNFTINPLPTISGTLSACVGQTSNLSGSATAHSTTPWTSSNTAIATVSATGVVSGISAGAAFITYKNSNGCEQSVLFTVNDLPTISGTLSACVGQSSTLGGSATAHATTPWTSSNTAIATVSSTGIVTGISSGSVNITYRNSNNCIQTASFTVNPLPTISGTLNTCIGQSTTLTGSTTPHPSSPWTSSNAAIATVSSTGVVSGISAGTVTITYRNINDCITTASFTVNALPTITGTLVACVGSSSTLSGSTTAHATTPWTSSNTAIATVSSLGVVTGISSGTAFITYRNSNGCEQSVLFTVNALPTISGALSVCEGQKTTLSGSATAHTSAAWSSSNTAVATVSSTGEVTGVSAGTTIITYQNSNNCTQSISFTVNPLPSAPAVISPLNLCIGSAASSLTASGTNLKWYTTSIGGTASTIAPIPNTSSLGSTNYYVSQSNTFGCEGLRALLQVKVQPLPIVTISSLSKSGFVVCRNSDIILKANAATAIAYQWSFDGTNKALAIYDTTTVDTAGRWSVMVTDIYGCKASSEVTTTKDFSRPPVLSPTEMIVCKEGGGLLTCSPGFVSYTFEWMKDGIPLLPVTTKENLKNANESGFYSVIVTNSVGCVDTTNASHVTNYPAPIKPIIVNSNPILEVAKTYKYYRWFRNGLQIIGANGFNFKTTSPGLYHVEVTDENGCLNFSDTVEILKSSNINSANTIKSELKIYPNPTNDIVHIEAPVMVNVQVLDILGRLVIDVVDVHTISLSNLSAGTYIFKISDENNHLISIEKITKND